MSNQPGVCTSMPRVTGASDSSVPGPLSWLAQKRTKGPVVATTLPCFTASATACSSTKPGSSVMLAT